MLVQLIQEEPDMWYALIGGWSRSTRCEDWQLMCLCFGRAIFFVEMHPSVFASQSLARQTGPTSPRGTGCCLSDGSFIIFFNLNAGETISLQETGYFQDCSQHVSFFPTFRRWLLRKDCLLQGAPTHNLRQLLQLLQPRLRKLHCQRQLRILWTICSQRVRSLRRVRSVQVAGMFWFEAVEAQKVAFFILFQCVGNFPPLLFPLAHVFSPLNQSWPTARGFSAFFLAFMKMMLR